MHFWSLLWSGFSSACDTGVAGVEFTNGDTPGVRLRKRRQTDSAGRGSRVTLATLSVFWRSAYVLQRTVSGRTKSHELRTLLPWDWHPDNAATATG